MINPKYFSDIANFPQQFQTQRDMSYDAKHYDRVIVCGMGGSSLRVDLVNDLLIAQGETFQLESRRGYGLPTLDTEKTLCVVCSYSGNTVEVLDAHDHILEVGVDHIVITAGGKLLERANYAGIPTYQIQAVGMQPRLCTGYFISAISDILVKIGIVKQSLVEKFSNFPYSSESLSDRAQSILMSLGKSFTPVVYTDQSLAAMARICKIKRNENAKIPAFSGVVPEMCHNELSGWMTQTFQPTIFLIDHGLMHVRNRKRMQVMKTLLEQDGYITYTIRLESDTVAHQVIELTMLTDYMTYWHSNQRGVDPEPVKIIEDFKGML